MSDPSPATAAPARGVGPVGRVPRQRGSGAPVAPSAVGWRFVVEYAAAYTGAVVVLIAPLVVTLAIRLDDLVGDRAPSALALVAGLGALVAMVANPVFGHLSDRTTSPYGMRRPWLAIGLVGGSLGTLIVALAPNVATVVVGWCLAQAFFNGVLAALLAVLPDQVPTRQRGLVSGVLGVCLPVASVVGTFLVRLSSPHTLAMFLAPCALAAVLVGWFAARLDDRRLEPTARASWSWRGMAPGLSIRSPASADFRWAFASRFLFVLAFACLTSYEAFYLLDRLNSSDDAVPGQVFAATLLQSGFVVVASLVAGPLSDRSGRRKVFVGTAAVVFAVGMLVLAAASDLTSFYVALAVSGVGLGLYVSIDLALVVDVLPDSAASAKDLGLFNIAGALPYSLAPAAAPALLAAGGYTALYGAAAVCAVGSAICIAPVRAVH